VQGPLKFNFVTMNDLPAGMTSVDIPTALHARLHALKNAYNNIYV
jgi:hypothetical protein